MRPLTGFWIGIVLSSLVFAGCSSTTLSGSWADPNFTGPVNKVFIVGLSNHNTTRRMFEDEFAQQLGRFNASGLPSYLSLPDTANIDEEKVATQVAENGADAILMAYVTGRRTEEVVNPGRATTISTSPAHHHRHSRPSHRHYRGYFDRHRVVVFEPTTISQFQIVIVDASLYSAKTGEPIWSAQLETVVEQDLQRQLTDFIRTVVQDLDRNRLI